MKALLFSISSIFSGVLLAFLISLSTPDRALAACSEDCQLICGDPGNIVCTGFTCEEGSVICTKNNGDPGIPVEN